jgi:magnesium-transporting ATPase (P-type)
VCCVLQGTLVTSGRARAVVVGTGAATAIGRIRDAMTVQVSPGQAGVPLYLVASCLSVRVLALCIGVWQTALSKW